MIDHRKLVGQQGESLVAHSLEQQGFHIEERNYRKQYGEIDIIARKGTLVVFVEVKSRAHAYFPLEELVTPSKQRKIILVAKAYIASQQLIDLDFRFDIAVIEGNKVTYIENAFTEGEQYG
jgi:putative endonuclease